MDVHRPGTDDEQPASGRCCLCTTALPAPRNFCRRRRGPVAALRQRPPAAPVPMRHAGQNPSCTDEDPGEGMISFDLRREHIESSMLIDTVLYCSPRGPPQALRTGGRPPLLKRPPLALVPVPHSSPSPTTSHGPRYHRHPQAHRRKGVSFSLHPAKVPVVTSNARVDASRRVSSITACHPTRPSDI